MQKASKKKEGPRVASIERILSCAIDLFVKDGYRATTVDVIAARAGLTKGAVYFYFKSKEAIMLRLLDEAEAIVVEPLTACIDRAGPSAIDKIATFLNHQSGIAFTHPQHLLLLILMSIEFYGSNTENEVRVRSIYRRLYAIVDRIIHQGQAEGSIRTDIRSHELTSVVVAEHDGTLVEWYRRPGELEGKSLAKAVRLTLLDGLKTRL